MTPEDINHLTLGMSLVDAAQKLNDLGHRTPTGLLWTGENLRVYLSRKGLRRTVAKPRIMTQEAEKERIETLGAEGMPASWISEDIQRNRDYVHDHVRALPGRDKAIQEWRKLWPKIRQNATLLELHKEFAPK